VDGEEQSSGAKLLCKMYYVIRNWHGIALSVHKVQQQLLFPIPNDGYCYYMFVTTHSNLHNMEHYSVCIYGCPQPPKTFSNVDSDFQARFWKRSSPKNGQHSWEETSFLSSVTDSSCSIKPRAAPKGCCQVHACRYHMVKSSVLWLLIYSLTLQDQFIIASSFRTTQEIQ